MITNVTNTFTITSINGYPALISLAASPPPLKLAAASTQAFVAQRASTIP